MNFDAYAYYYIYLCWQKTSATCVYASICSINIWESFKFLIICSAGEAEREPLSLRLVFPIHRNAFFSFFLLQVKNVSFSFKHRIAFRCDHR